MKTFNKLISLAIISMTSLVYTACSDSFFNRYPTDSMQMETYLKNDTELQNILFNGYYHLQDITLNVNYVNSLATDEKQFCGSYQPERKYMGRNIRNHQ